MDLILQLTEVEARVVGSMVEKAFLTPDIYPMTTNALVSACNQKTNRDPVVSYDAKVVDATLLELRQRNIVRRVHTQGSRSTKHRHALDEVHELDQAELALISVLLLRGPQTIGELRLRTERQNPFDSLEQVEACLEAMAARPSALVRQLERQPGQKEARWQHLLSGDSPAAAPETAPVAAPVSAPTASPGSFAPASSAPSPQHTPAAPYATPAPATAPALSGSDQDLINRVAELESEVETLRTQLHLLAEQLGEPLA